MHLAATRGDTKAIQALLEAGADPNVVGERGRTPLHAALEQRHRQAARMLIAAGCSLDAKNSDGLTARDMTKDFALWETEN